MKLFAVAPLAMLLAVQSGVPSEKPAASPAALSARITALEHALEQEQLARVRGTYLFERRPLDCVSHETVEILEKGGKLAFLVRCDNIEPYLEGYRVALKIGNPYSAEFGNSSLTLLYGKDAGDAFGEGNQVKVGLPSLLSSGSWVHVTATVGRAKVEQMRFIALELTVGTVRLRDTSSGM